MNAQSKTPLLGRVRYPADLRNLSTDQLEQLAAELRLETIDAVSVTGGHLGASLGVVELTVALHAVFDTPRDRLIWDVDHDSRPRQYDQAGLIAPQIVATVLGALGRPHIRSKSTLASTA